MAMENRNGCGNCERARLAGLKPGKISLLDDASAAASVWHRVPAAGAAFVRVDRRGAVALARIPAPRVRGKPAHRPERLVDGVRRGGELLPEAERETARTGRGGGWRTGGRQQYVQWPGCPSRRGRSRSESVRAARVFPGRAPVAKKRP